MRFGPGLGLTPACDCAHGGPAPGDHFVVLVNPWTLQGSGGETMQFFVNGVSLGEWTVDPVEGNISPTYETVVGRTDPTITEHGNGTVGGSFLDEFTNARLALDGPAWAGADAYVELDPALIVPGANAATVVLTGAGITGSEFEVVVVRVEFDGAQWVYALNDAEDPDVVIDFHRIGAPLGATVQPFTTDGSDAYGAVTTLTFSQDGGTDFDYDFDLSGPSAYLPIELSEDGVVWAAFWTPDPGESGPYTDPWPSGPFTPGNTYYLRARYQDQFENPYQTGPWTVRSFVAT